MPASLARHVAASLRRRCGVEPGARLLVGVSGGVDSVALLAVLADIAPQASLRLEIAHFDHALRAGSSGDARFVAELGAALGIPVHGERWTAPVRGEAAARRARHAFLARCGRSRGADAVALAHHLDDQIETVLLRLARGAGVRGSLGMAWRRAGSPPIVRPLLDVRRRALMDFARGRGLAWRQDPSNGDTRLARNRLRLVGVPALDRALGNGWMQRWGAALGDMREAWSWLEAAARELLARAGREAEGAGAAVEAGVLAAAPPILMRTALQLWLEPRAPELGRSHLTAAQSLLRNGHSGQSVQLPGGQRLWLEQGRAVVREDRGEEGPRLARRRPGRAARPEAAVPELEMEALAPRAARALVAARRLARPAPPPGDDEAVVAEDAIAPPLAVRRPLPGDRVRLLGAPGNRKLARILQDHRVPRALRAGWPVVTDGRGILWIPGIGVAERARVGAATRRALRLRLVSRAARVAQVSSEP